MNTELVRHRIQQERHRLLAVRRELEDDLAQEATAATSELSSLDQHVADLASDLLEREQSFSLLDAVDHELAELQAAVARVEDGTYGRCQMCGRRISDERLEAVPAARDCAVHTFAALPGGGGSAAAAAAREAAHHLEFLVTDDELDADDTLSAEEAAMHVVPHQEQVADRSRSRRH